MPKWRAELEVDVRWRVWVGIRGRGWMTRRRGRGGCGEEGERARGGGEEMEG